MAAHRILVPLVRVRVSMSQQYIELWCNGNIEDSGSFVLGSNPSSSTKKSKKYHKDFFENQIHGIIDL